MADARPRRRSLRLPIAALISFLLVLAGWQSLQAAGRAQDGKTALHAATQALATRNFGATQTHLEQAVDAFSDVQSGLREAGPVVWIARYVPYLRVQVQAVDAMADAGSAASRAGLSLLPTVNALRSQTGSADTAALVVTLGRNRPAVTKAAAELSDADRRLRRLDRFRLLGPLQSARAELRPQLADATAKARRGAAGLIVLSDLLGGSGDRRYLVLSQNPDEPRPTGGYHGTYGLIESSRGHARLTRYAAMGDWYAAHPAAGLPPAQAATAFRRADPPVEQSLGDVNTTPDWPTAAALAVRIWEGAGEPDVDGALTFTPALIAKLLGVLGPVQVQGYPEAFTAANVAQQLDFFTHGAGVRGSSLAERKQVVGDLARVVLQRTIDAPAAQLPDLAAALVDGLDTGDAALWSSRSDVAAALTQERWDGAFRGADGDFYADVEFAYGTKNGSLLRRTVDHTATLRIDGSGTSRTVLTIDNPAPFEFLYNPGSPTYLTPVGPRGGELTARSDRAAELEGTLDGHPVAGFFRTAVPAGKAVLTTEWDAPRLALPRTDGAWEYRLQVRPTPGHPGDILRLRVVLPNGWRWAGEPPPASVRLDAPFRGRWLLRSD